MPPRLLNALAWPIAALLAACSTPAATTRPSVATTQSAEPPTAIQPTTAPSSPTALAAPAPTDSNPRDTLPYLASDQLQGRGVGLPGLQIAGDFIASEFAADGLQPLPGFKDYFQPFPFQTTLLKLPENSLKLGSQTLVAGKDFSPLRFTADGQFSAPVVFAGYGVSDPKAGYDDYAGIDAKGKVVLILRFEPIDHRGRSRLLKPTDDPGWSANSLFASKVDNAKAHGAAAILLVQPPGSEPNQLMSFLSAGPSDALALPVAEITRAAADRLLAASHQPDLKTLCARIDAQFTPQSVALNELAQGNLKIERPNVPVRNVMGMIPGKGPHADEFVIVGAHYDHLGFGGAGAFGAAPGSIFHGADDNASGTTAVLELASRFAQQARTNPPPRTLIFMTFTAEESGLIGSKYFVNHSPVDLFKIVAMLNLDMVGRLHDNTLYIGGQGTATDFDSIVASAQSHTKLAVKSMGRGGLGPSDHMMFALKHVPVIFLFSGLHPDYHRPTDVASKINYVGQEQIIDFASDLIDGMARMPQDPYIVEADKDSFSLFGGPGPFGSTGQRHVILGVIPDYGSVESHVGVLIAGTTPKTPAQAAGLQNGDLLIQFGATKLTNLMDLTQVLARSRPGDKMTLTILRGGKTLKFDITLAERKD
jgi:hypothetical protein